VFPSKKKKIFVSNEECKLGAVLM